MSHYELTYIISAALAETEYPNIQKQVNELISGKLKGAVSRESILGRKKLAYPIKKEKHGYYVTVEFDLDPASVKELDRLLMLNNSLLRHLIVTKKVLTPEQEEVKAGKLAKIKARKQLKQEKLKPVSKPAEKKAPKISLDKLDEKLDELLGQEIK